MTEAELEEGEETPPAAPPAELSISRAQRLLTTARSLFLRGVSSLPPPAFEGASRGMPPSAFTDSSNRELMVERCEPSEDDCPICLTTLDEAIIRTPCDHKFHAACIERYFLTSRQPGCKATCPLCRQACHVPLPIEVSAASQRPIEIVSLPASGNSMRCHFDRGYTFLDLGGFAEQQNMLYVMTSNDDRKTPRDRVMWTLDSKHTLNVHLNFRSDKHVTNGGCERWLEENGWAPNKSIRSTVSSGTPNGPYAGPVYSKTCPPGRTLLYGSNNCALLEFNPESVCVPHS